MLLDFIVNIILFCLLMIVIIKNRRLKQLVWPALYDVTITYQLWSDLSKYGIMTKSYQTFLRYVDKKDSYEFLTYFKTLHTIIKINSISYMRIK